jgi:nicotinamide mononucleotide adenylyltransferase
MNIKHHITPSDYQVGVIVGRFQTHYLHEGHLDLISHVLENHSQVIIMLGISRKQNSKRNPLDFATRKLMIENDLKLEYTPNCIFLISEPFNNSEMNDEEN